MTLAGAAAATVWVEEAGLDPRRPLSVRTDADGPAELTLAGSFGERTVAVPPGETERTVELCR